MTAELFRDDWGVPHLRADDELELADAQGRVTALDRAWQIESDRWRAEGRLAEHVGPSGLEWDRFARRTRIVDTARRAYDRLSSEDRAWVDAYVAGVNAALPAARRHAPEFATVARIPGDDPAPTPWESWVPLAIMLANHILFSNLPSLLWRGHASAIGADARVFAAEPDPGSGSNAWAIHGSRTESGSPILAGDPHRVLQLPGVYQQIRLACPAYDVVGLAFPGVPGIPHFGHTGSAAWGITNAVAHGTDVFRERLRRTDGGIEALGPDGWEGAAAGIERVAVRGAGPVDVEVIETRRGPVIADHDGDAVSIRYASRAGRDLGFAALRPLLRARSADDVAAAFRAWVDPVNRVLAADRTGRVLRFTAGRVPERSAAGWRLPLDAETARADAGWVRLPDPEVVDELAVDANERPNRPGHELGAGFGSDHRARRIRELLTGPTPPRSAADLGVIWYDVRAGTAAPLLGRLRAGLGDLSPAAAALRDRLLAWDREMSADSTGAAEYTAWRSAVVTRIAALPRLAPLARPSGYGPVADPWFSVRARVAGALAAILDGGLAGLDVDAELRAALERVADDPPRTWGDTHRLLTIHLLDAVPEVAADAVPAVPGIPLDGDSDCVRWTGSVPGITDLATRGSVARWAWDLGDRRRSRWIVPCGASGDPRDPHFADQLPLWAGERTIEIVTDWDSLRRAPLPPDPAR
jgi:penicillin amidase